jgi:hypothetical protein
VVAGQARWFGCVVAGQAFGSGFDVFGQKVESGRDVAGQTSGLGWDVRGHLRGSGFDVDGQTFASGWDVWGPRESGWLARGQTRGSPEVVPGTAAATATRRLRMGAGLSAAANSGESVTSPAEAHPVRPRLLQRPIVTSTAAAATMHPKTAVRFRV